MSLGLLAEKISRSSKAPLHCDDVPDLLINLKNQVISTPKNILPLPSLTMTDETGRHSDQLAVWGLPFDYVDLTAAVLTNGKVSKIFHLLENLTRDKSSHFYDIPLDILHCIEDELVSLSFRDNKAVSRTSVFSSTIKMSPPDFGDTR